MRLSPGEGDGSPQLREGGIQIRLPVDRRSKETTSHSQTRTAQTCLESLLVSTLVTWPDLGKGWGEQLLVRVLDVRTWGSLNIRLVLFIFLQTRANQKTFHRLFFKLSLIFFHFNWCDIKNQKNMVSYEIVVNLFLHGCTLCFEAFASTLLLFLSHWMCNCSFFGLLELRSFAFVLFYSTVSIMSSCW